jgi:hypothetical protein
MKNWQTLTVEDYQLLMQVQTSDLDDFEKEIQICSMLADCTPSDIEAMDFGDYVELKKQISFVYEKPPEAKPKMYWRKYRFIYDVRKINTGRYISIQTFLQGGLIENLHNLAACIVNPRFSRYDATKHEKYANDMKAAPLVYILSSMLFFCNLFEQSVTAIIDKVTPETMTSEAMQAVILLKKNLDGLFTRKDLQNTIDVR